MNKIGLIILFFAFPMNYTLKYNLKIGDIKADYASTFMMCIGLSIIAFYFGKYSESRKAKYLYFYPIAIFNLSLVLTYSIDLLIDPIFQTGKIIWSFIIATFLSLCIYLLWGKH